MANKIYSVGNYVIGEDDRGASTKVLSFAKRSSEYFVTSDPDGYGVKEANQSTELVIDTTDIPNWFDEAGVVAYTEATLLTFLRENTANY